MNPPSALHGAMSRDRKPFTYTPGGIDLSEIKSQRMAQRLMRNAMNPGVPEVPVHPVLPSMPTPTAAKALPSYSCLPVQVFPAMPANPKQLLRTRSNPDPRDGPTRVIPPTSVNNARYENNDTSFKNNTSPFSQQINNNRPSSMYDYSKADKSYNPGLNYGSDGYTAPVALNLPTNKPAYGYAPVAPPVFAPIAAPSYTPVLAPIPTSAPVLPEISDEPEFFRIPNYDRDDKSNEQLSELKTFEEKDIVPANDSVEASLDWTVNLTEDVTVRPIQEETVVTTPLVTNIVEDSAEIDDEKREVKVVKKQVTKENKVEKQNGDQNGDENGEAEMTVKLPTKKSGAKTETKVEVEKRTLPDGSTEEVKTTTTKTTIDGRTEIKTRTETTIIPKEDESEEEVVEEEEEEVAVAEEVEEQNESEEPETVTITQTISAPKENGSIVKTEERSETTITKKVAIVQELPQPEETEEADDEEIEEDEVEEAVPVTVVLKKPVTPEPEPESKPVEEDEEEEEVEEIEEEPKPTKQEEVEQVEDKQEVEEEEIQEEVEEEVEVKTAPTKEDEEEHEEEEEYEEAEEQKQDVEVKEEKTEDKETVVEQKEEPAEEPPVEVKEESVPEEVVEEQKEVPKAEEHVVPIQISEEPKSETKEEKPAEFTIPIREPSVPLEKVEDVEIKPIGMSPIIQKTHTENTEIITSTIDPSGGVSKQTEYNKIENIVTVNRTTKILDHSYENITQQGVPTVKTYFPPPSIDRISTSPMPSRPYQPVYPPEPTTERRHSLLLERLSMERQMPSDIINQYSNQTYEQTQYQGEPQSEVLTVSNVKPSSITNQQWFQQNKQTQSIYNNVTSNSAPVGAPWAHPKSPQPQQQYQPQPQYQAPAQPQYQPPTQPQYQPPAQPQYQAQYQPPQLQRGTTPQPQFQRGTTPQPAYQKPTTPQPQYQPSFSEPIRDRTPTNNYSTYTPTPTWVANAVETPPTTYSYLNKDTSQSYQKNTLSSTTQQYSSGYVPPPWEQDSSYTSVNNTSEKFYQEVPQTNTFSPAPSQGWKPTPPSAKFTKPAPIAYVPPAPNQSFVKPVVELPKQPGRKTYYSEYERRYITVPESTYIPTETKYQAQPDASPQYYYDNNEPSETVEPQWRRELREFTEKTSQTITTEQTNVQPPWEADPKYVKEPAVPYTPTPSWTTQTLRPQSYSERTFESELSQEWPKTSTLGRRRPLSTLGVGNDGKVTERARGVSVDRYNPNSYQPPAEHPPVQTHTLTTPTPHASYHNPNVPAYHARASAEPREQPINYQRVYREARASPLQSRSFKYLQWITGTEN